MKKLLVVFASVLALSVPAFADADPSFASEVYYGFSSDQTSTFHLYTASDVYFYAKLTGSTTYIYAISETRGSVYYQSMTNSTPSEFSTGTTFGDYYNNLVTYSSSIFFGAPLSVFPSGTSDADIQAAFATFIESNNTPAIPSSFTVPCGNVLYFKVDREQDVTFTAVMPVLSSLLGTPTGAWNSGIQYGPAAALPSSGTTFPILSQDPINFAKTVSNQNLLGQTKNAISTKHCIAGQYYSLYLPYHYGGWLALGSSHVYPDGSTSGGIVGANVTVSGSFAEIKVYPLTEKANGDLLTGSVTLDSGSDDGFSSYFDGEISETGTVTWLDQNGDISSPSVGGTSYVPDDVSTESIIDQIKNILSSIVSEIKNLFSFGYEAVNTLVSLMHDFVGVFKQLYEWLPTEVYSALISAIIVAITIGVFKVFL